MNTFAVTVEHPHKGRIVRTARTVEAKNFDHAVEKALQGFPEPRRVMSVEWEVTPPEAEEDLFEGLE